MEKLILDTKRLKPKKEIERRLRQFKSFKNKSSEDWFAELCFCLLTANSKAKTALKIEKDLGKEGFCNSSMERVKECIRENKHRFHNNKAEYICMAREHLDIKRKIRQCVREEGEQNAREWLAKNIKGLGYKEASHFLRNVGYENIAIVDRHILNILSDYGIMYKPVNITKSVYMETENKLSLIAGKVGMSLAELDLYLWYMKTGEVLK